MTHQFTVTVEERHVKSALNHYFVKTAGHGACIVLAVFVLSVAWMIYQHVYSFIFVTLDIFIVVVLGFVLIGYCTRRNRALQRLKKISPHEVHYELTEDGIGSKTSLAEGKVKWEMLSDLWMLPDVWLLILADRNTFITLPADQLSEEVKSFLQQKIPASAKKN